MTVSGCSSPSGLKKNNYVRIETLSGVEAEVIKAAVERFQAEKINIAPHEYEISIFLNNDDYVVLFEKAKSASLGPIDLGYEVVITAKTLKVSHAHFRRPEDPFDF